MSRARRAGRVALPIALVPALLATPLVSAARRPETQPLDATAPVVLAAVAWPVSTLVISEVETGGASASDEFAEIANAGALPVDALIDRLGLELPDDRDYATAAGYALSVLKRLPHEGENFTEQDWRFEVVDMDGRKIDKLLVCKARKFEAADPLPRSS